MIEGGSAACNVLPQNMRAVINFRLNQGETADSLMSRCREAVSDPRVSLRFLQANDPSAAARSDGFGYQKLTEAMADFFPGVLFIPSMTAGATVDLLSRSIHGHPTLSEVMLTAARQF